MKATAAVSRISDDFLKNNGDDLEKYDYFSRLMQNDFRVVQLIDPDGLFEGTAAERAAAANAYCIRKGWSAAITDEV